MPKPAIPHDAFVFVGDGRKALFLRNAGDEKFANFVTERVFVDEENPSTHEQGTDRPGRGFASAGSTRRSAMEPTDWHEIEEHRFVQRASEALERLVRERASPALIIAAPPRTLADLRNALPRGEGENRSRNQQGFHQTPRVGNRATHRRIAGGLVILPADLEKAVFNIRITERHWAPASRSTLPSKTSVGSGVPAGK